MKFILAAALLVAVSAVQADNASELKSLKLKLELLEFGIDNAATRHTYFWKHMKDHITAVVENMKDAFMKMSEEKFFRPLIYDVLENENEKDKKCQTTTVFISDQVKQEVASRCDACVQQFSRKYVHNPNLDRHYHAFVQSKDSLKKLFASAVPHCTETYGNETDGQIKCITDMYNELEKRRVHFEMFGDRIDGIIRNESPRIYDEATTCYKSIEPILERTKAYTIIKSCHFF